MKLTRRQRKEQKRKAHYKHSLYVLSYFPGSSALGDWTWIKNKEDPSKWDWIGKKPNKLKTKKGRIAYKLACGFDTAEQWKKDADNKAGQIPIDRVRSRIGSLIPLSNEIWMSGEYIHNSRFDIISAYWAGRRFRGDCGPNPSAPVDSFGVPIAKELNLGYYQDERIAWTQGWEDEHARRLRRKNESKTR